VIKNCLCLLIHKKTKKTNLKERKEGKRYASSECIKQTELIIHHHHPRSLFIEGKRFLSYQHVFVCVRKSFQFPPVNDFGWRFLRDFLSSFSSSFYQIMVHLERSDFWESFWMEGIRDEKAAEACKFFVLVIWCWSMTEDMRESQWQHRCTIIFECIFLKLMQRRSNSIIMIKCWLSFRGAYKQGRTDGIRRKI
jgi:hypothetical protein